MQSPPLISLDPQLLGAMWFAYVYLQRDYAVQLDGWGDNEQPVTPHNLAEVELGKGRLVKRANG